MKLSDLHALNEAARTPGRNMLEALQVKAAGETRVVTAGGRAVRKHGHTLTETGHIYAGTVPPEVVAKRRARNKRARAARRAAR